MPHFRLNLPEVEIFVTSANQIAKPHGSFSELFFVCVISTKAAPSFALLRRVGTTNLND